MRTKLNMLVAVALVAAGCGAAAPEQLGVDLVIQGLAPLEGGFHYEGWVVVDGQDHSTGPFNVAADGVLVDLEDTMILDPFATETDLTEATDFFVTIQAPNPDAGPGPSEVRVLGGELVDGVAELSVASEHALGDDFTTASGVFILATPSDGPASNERSGVWFMTLDGRAGLQLPELPSGWTYEGWVTVEGTPLSTGTFRDPDGPDDASPYSGDEEVPPFPGEDFLLNPPGDLEFPTDLRGERVFVSIEPVLDPDPGSFWRVLSHKVPDDAFDHVGMMLTRTTADLPTGTVTLLGIG